MALPVRVIGRQVAITTTGLIGGGNSVTIWQELGLTFAADTANATAADSTLNETVITTMMLEGTLSGFLGVINSGATLPLVGAAVAGLAVAVGADSVIPSLTNYTNMKITRAEYRLSGEPGTFSLAFRSGVLIGAPF